VTASFNANPRAVRDINARRLAGVPVEFCVVVVGVQDDGYTSNWHSTVRNSESARRSPDWLLAHIAIWCWRRCRPAPRKAIVGVFTEPKIGRGEAR
jgi:hypothetical protein